MNTRTGDGHSEPAESAPDGRNPYGRGVPNLADPARPVFAWVAIGSKDSPPGRMQIETCVSCAALVPVSEFDRHGAWHAEQAV